MTTMKSTLFVQHLAEDYATWYGRLWTLEDYRCHYEVDEVYYVEDVSFFSLYFYACKISNIFLSLKQLIYNKKIFTQIFDITCYSSFHSHKTGSHRTKKKKNHP